MVYGFDISTAHDNSTLVRDLMHDLIRQAIILTNHSIYFVKATDEPLFCLVVWEVLLLTRVK